MSSKLTWLPAAAISISIVVIGFSYSSHRLSDFTGYYTAARALASGDSLANLYSDNWFKERVRTFGISESTYVMYVNPPPIALLLQPLQQFNPFLAKEIWNSFNVVLLLLAFSLSSKYFNLMGDSRLQPVLFVLLGCTIPFLRNLQRGQIYIFMLVLVLLMLLGYRQRQPWMTGAPLSILLLLKYFGWMFLLLFLIERRWKEFAATVLCFVTELAICILLEGASTYAAHLQYLVRVFKGNDFAFTGLPSVQAFFGSLFISNARWNPGPIEDIPWLAHGLTFTTLAIGLFVSLWVTRSDVQTRGRRPLIVLALSVMFTPLAADHHYVLLALPAFSLLQSYKYPPDRIFVIPAATIYALLGWYPELHIAQFDGLGKLLCFPRLYACFLVWFLLLWRMRHGLMRQA